MKTLNIFCKVFIMKYMTHFICFYTMSRCAPKFNYEDNGWGPSIININSDKFDEAENTILLAKCHTLDLLSGLWHKLLFYVI